MRTEFIHTLRALSSLIEISMDQLRRANTLALIDDGFSTYGIIISESAYPERYILRISIRRETESEELNTFKSVIVALREKEILQICRVLLRLLSVIRSYKPIRPRISGSETLRYEK